jgi:hypothetical protein
MFYGPNRTICQVLEEMRALDKTKNYSAMKGLIEEAQSLANRMEAKLYDQKDYDRMMEDAKELKQEIKELKSKKKELE